MSPEIRDIIQTSLDAIEANLRAELSAQELADAAGFSLYHYYHVFEAVTGMSLGRYITHRRLLHALWDMSRGKDAITAALDYGFDTHAGFYKAFRKEFGCAPSRYLRSHRAARPPRVNLKEEPRMIDMKTLSRALSAWGMAQEPVSHIYYTNTGHRSETTFAVGQKHYLKTSTQLGELERQAALQQALRTQGLAAAIIPTQSGETVLHQDGLDLMLMERASGQPVDPLALLDDPTQARALGEGLARLHAALRSCDPLLCYAEDYTATLRDWAIPAARAAMVPEPLWLKDYQARMEAAFPALPTQIIHRDPNPDNLLLADGRVVGFLDFDLTRILPRIFDICYAATGILCDAWPHATEVQRLRFFDVTKAIWQGYDAASPLTPEEWTALPDMVLAIQLTCVAAFAGSNKLVQQFEVNQHMLQFILNNIQRFQ